MISSTNGNYDLQMKRDISNSLKQMEIQMEIIESSTAQIHKV